VRTIRSTEKWTPARRANHLAHRLLDPLYDKYARRLATRAAIAAPTESKPQSKSDAVRLGTKSDATRP